MNSQRWIIITMAAITAVAWLITVAVAQPQTPCPIGGYATVACPVVNDEIIQSTVISRLAGSVSSPKYPVNVQVKNGIVTLTGQIADDARKQMATILAASMRGVACVNNRLIITGTTQTDINLTRDVIRELGRQPFRIRRIQVSIVDQVADLRGEVDTDYDRTQAGLTAESVPGITAVHNNLIVMEAGGTF